MKIRVENMNRKYEIKFVHLKFYFQEMLNTGDFE